MMKQKQLRPHIERTQWEWPKSFETSRCVPTNTPPPKASPPNHSQTVSPCIHTFTQMSYEGHSHQSHLY